MIEIYVKRYTTSIDGDLSYIESDSSGAVIESESIRNISIRTGIRLTPDDWQRGISGCPVGEHLLWVGRKHIKQYSDLDATGNEIGRFYPISSSSANVNILRGEGKHRTHIGLHDENDNPGSAGCIVVVCNKEWRNLCQKLDQLTKAGIQYVKIIVFKGKQGFRA